MNKNFKNIKQGIYDQIEREGYCKIKLFSEAEIQKFKSKIIDNLNKKKLIKKKFNYHNLSKYHKIVLDENVHKKFLSPSSRYFKFHKNIIKKIKTNKSLIDLINNSWKEKTFDIRLYYKNFVKKNFTAFRIARPYKKFKGDVGGVHIDLHFNNKIYKNHKILYTIWTPVLGFDEKNTLRISPLSHKKNHPVSKIEKQKKYISKIFMKKYIKNFKFFRPKMNIGDVLIIHPNLLHGESKNLSNKTRVSFDFRIFNSKLI